MARVNILNTRTMDFGELIGNGKTYRVPPYQRDYSWSEEEWAKLWNDIVELQSDPGREHCMGAAVVEARTERSLVLLDGLQRAATLTLLALAVVRTIQYSADSGAEGADNLTRAQALRSRFIVQRDPALLIETSKISLNEGDDPFFQAHLVAVDPPRPSALLRTSHRLLWECFEYFTGRISELHTTGCSTENLAGLLSETIARKLLFIVTMVEVGVTADVLQETTSALGQALHRRMAWQQARATGDVS